MLGNFLVLIVILDFQAISRRRPHASSSSTLKLASARFGTQNAPPRPLPAHEERNAHDRVPASQQQLLIPPYYPYLQPPPLPPLVNACSPSTARGHVRHSHRPSCDVAARPPRTPHALRPRQTSRTTRSKSQRLFLLLQPRPAYRAFRRPPDASAHLPVIKTAAMFSETERQYRHAYTPRGRSFRADFVVTGTG